LTLEFLTQSVLEKGIPFEIRKPNDETLKAVEEYKNKDGEEISFDEFSKESKC